jgi:hypothetical protein
MLSGRSMNRFWIQCVAKWITYIKCDTPALLKITLFWLFHTDQHKAYTPICILALVSLSMPFSQLADILFILVRGGMFYVLKNNTQNNFTKRTWKKKTTFLTYFHYLLIRLCFVSKTFLFRTDIVLLDRPSPPWLSIQYLGPTPNPTSWHKDLPFSLINKKN